MTKPVLLFSAAVAAVFGAAVCVTVFSKTKPAESPAAGPAHVSSSPISTSAVSSSRPPQNATPVHRGNSPLTSQGRPPAVVSSSNGNSAASSTKPTSSAQGPGPSSANPDPLNPANAPLATSPSTEVPLNFGGNLTGGRNNGPLGTRGESSGESNAAAQTPSNGQTGTGPATGTTEIALSVPGGSIVPAAFMDRAPRTPQQQAAIDQIAQDFEEAVSNPPPGVSPEENWNTARQLADQRYLTLFGYQAYNQYHLQAAKEAVKEQNAQAANSATK